MTWSIQLRNGDLALGQASLGTVTGSQKLAQDLRCFILERMGTDDLHPSYGSLIDGGTRNGEYVAGVIGELNDDLTLTVIEGELRRIVKAYQAMQLERARADRDRYGKATLSKGEVLIQLTSIEAQRAQDALYLTLNLLTAQDEEIALNLGLSTL